jgi:hypothetical protein
MQAYVDLIITGKGVLIIAEDIANSLIIFLCASAYINSSLFNEFLCKLGFFGTSAKNAQFTQKRLEYNVFLFDENKLDVSF